MTVFDMINAVYYDKPLICIEATFQKKLISIHQAVNTFEYIKAVSDMINDCI